MMLPKNFWKDFSIRQFSHAFYLGVGEKAQQGCSQYTTRINRAVAPPTNKQTSQFVTQT